MRGVRGPPLRGGGGVCLVPESSCWGVEGVSWAAAPGPVLGFALVRAGPTERGSGMLVPEAANGGALVGNRGCGCEMR